MRDEAAELPKLFEALERLEQDRCDMVHICLLLDGCVDESAALAASYRDRSSRQVWIKSVARCAPSAGRARHEAMMLGIGALDGGDGLLLTTDADSAPTPNWLRAMSASLDAAELVAGKVARAGQRPNPLQSRIEAYYDALFALRRRLDPVAWEAKSTHHHTSGANIGVRFSAYTAIGGFAPVASGEDAQLIDDAARAGIKVRRDADSVVYTSDRREGRASNGMAGTLRHLDGGDPSVISVARPIDAAWQYRMQAIARGAYSTDQLAMVTAAIGLSYDHVCGVARDCPNEEAFAMRIVPVPPGGMRSVALPDAEAELAAIVDAREAA